ncbi:MAG TPA: methyltransferase domain-containing protein [Thermoanaerobaculia bacterium]|nr:methyltransferase domain-containing protein [Thermoanaerobaculia bacterium]
MQNPTILSSVVDYYESKLASFGATPQGVDWKDEASQRLRFSQLVRALGVDLHAAPKIIDFGCGYGALVPFLREQAPHFIYTGFDASEAMVAQANSLYGSEDVRFTSAWEDVPLSDFVIASGIFNVRLETSESAWWAYVQKTLTMIAPKASAGFAVNFLTSYSDEDRKRPDLFYANPGIVLDWCKTHVSRWVSLLHDYELYEFTVAVLRDPVRA